MITVSGLGSGLDIEGLVTQLVAAERQGPELRLARKEATARAELSAFGQLRGALANFQNASSGLDDAATFQRNTVTSSNPSAITATVESTAREGLYSVEVSQLAARHSLASAAFEGADSQVGTGSLTIRFGTTDYDSSGDTYNSFSVNANRESLTLEIDETNNSLEGISNAINEADAGINAAIVNDGTGYRLLLTSSTTGASNSLEISAIDDDADNADSNGLSQLSFSSSATNMTQTAAAADAIASINGLQLSSSENRLSEALDGVDITLNSTTEEPANLEVNRDTAIIAASIRGMIDAYNNFQATANSLAGFNAETQTGGLLQGDFTVNAIQNRVGNLLRSSLPDLSSDLNNLGAIGVSTNSNGTLSLDSSVLSEALANEPDKVVALFSSVATASSSQFSVLEFSKDSSAGNYAIDITTAATQASLAADSVLPDFSSGGSVVIDSDNDSFTVSVDGSTAVSIDLTQGTYTSGSELAAEIQSRINGGLSEDANIIVEYIAANSGFTLRSASYGSDSKLQISAVDTNTATTLGLQVASEVAGEDVTGTIGGEPATGSGQTLTANADSSLNGLSLRVTSATTGTIGDIGITRGLFHEMNNLLEEYLGESGIIGSRTDGLDSQLESLNTQRVDLNERMLSVEERYRSQFANLDLLLLQLQSTSDFLSQQLANLPGPRTPDQS